MTQTRIKVKQVNGKMEIVDKQNGIIDDNPVVYYGNEDSYITDDDVASGRVKYIGRGFSAFQEYIMEKKGLMRMVYQKVVGYGYALQGEMK